MWAVCFIQSPKTKEEGDDDVIEALGTMMEMIIQNTSTAIREPDLYAGQDLQDQVSQVLDKYGDLEISVVDWLEQTLAHLKSENEFETGRRLVLKIFMQIMAELHKVPFGVMGENSIKKIHYFTRTPLLATVFIMQHFVPNSPAVSGRSYMNSLLGILLSKSCLPDSDLETYDFFEEPSKQSASVHNHTEARIWTGLEIIQEICHGIINSLLRVDKSVKDWTLLWIGKCLEDNAGRGKMWTREAGPLLANTLASDGFMLNLGAVLLRFCQPFTEGVTNAKIMKIDPTYTSVEINVAEDAKLRQVHLRDAKKETFLVPSTDEEKEAENIPESFGFVTDIFFLTHKSLDLGFRVCHEKFVKMNQELGRQQQMYRDLQTQGQGSSPAAEVVQKRMEALMTRYLSLKAALLVPSTLQGAMFFSAASGSWMVQLALTLDSPRLARVQDLNFPLKEAGGENIPPSLKHVPEFVMENICELLLLVRRFCPRVFEQNGEYLSPILDFILTYMGSPKWVKNPHLRARLAECLECLLPHHQQEGVLNALGSFHREQLFQGHPHRYAKLI
jgi:ubiquitin conjugation factor E4 A